MTRASISAQPQIRIFPLMRNCMTNATRRTQSKDCDAQPQLKKSLLLTLYTWMIIPNGQMGEKRYDTVGQMFLPLISPVWEYWRKRYLSILDTDYQMQKGTNLGAKMVQHRKTLSKQSSVEFTAETFLHGCEQDRDQWREESFLPHPSQLKLKRTRRKSWQGLEIIMI